MKTISVNIPEAAVKGLEELVQKGLYANRSEAIRVAVRDLIKKELPDCQNNFERFIKEEKTILI